MASNIVLSTKEYKVVGKRPIRHDGQDKVTGRAKYGVRMNNLPMNPASITKALAEKNGK